jgi:hypothetical protein
MNRRGFVETKYFSYDKKKGTISDIQVIPSEVSQKSKDDITKILTEYMNSNMFVYLVTSTKGNFIVVQNDLALTKKDLNRWCKNYADECKNGALYESFQVFMECSYEDCKKCDDPGCNRHPMHILTY